MNKADWISRLNPRSYTKPMPSVPSIYLSSRYAYIERTGRPWKCSLGRHRVFAGGHVGGYVFPVHVSIPAHVPGNAMPYDPEQHHRRSVRLPEQEYASPGAYFVTICVQNKRRVFGCVDDEDVSRSPAGDVAWTCRHAIPDHHPGVYPSEPAPLVAPAPSGCTVSDREKAAPRWVRGAAFSVRTAGGIRRRPSRC